MATFGTPRAGSRDATHALRCARAMVRAIEAWNIERPRDGEQPVAIGVGVHYGPVAIGDVGDPSLSRSPSLATRSTCRAGCRA
jgi:adenylate cyclase